MWISAPTPVMSSTKHIDNWSSCSPKSTCKRATGTQVYSVSCRARSSAGRPSMPTNSATPTTKAPIGVAAPSRWPQLLERFPASISIAAPASGSTSSSQTIVVMAALVFQHAGVVDRGRVAGAENRHDDRQADHHLAGGDHHGEERHHLAVQMSMHAGECDKRQVRRIEHQRDTHEHDYGVAAQQHSGRADGEQQCRQVEIVIRVHGAPFFVLRASGSSAFLPASLVVLSTVCR